MHENHQPQDFNVCHDSLDRHISTIKNSGLFDLQWYMERYPDVASLGMEPVRHYLLIGANLLRDPCKGFSTSGYLALHKDVAATGLNPLVHYLLYGKAEGRKLPGLPTDAVGQAGQAKHHGSSPAGAMAIGGSGAGARCAIMAYVETPAQLQEIAQATANAPAHVDMLVTTSVGALREIAPALREAFSGRACHLRVSRGAGNTYLSMVSDWNPLALEYDLICRMEVPDPARCSPDYVSWGKDVLAQMAGSAKRVEDIVSLFGADQKLGFFCPPGAIVHPGAIPNGDSRCRAICAKLGMAWDPETWLVCIGGNYWFRPGAISPMFAADAIDLGWSGLGKFLYSDALGDLVLELAMAGGYRVIEWGGGKPSRVFELPSPDMLTMGFLRNTIRGASQKSGVRDGQDIRMFRTCLRFATKTHKCIVDAIS